MWSVWADPFISLVLIIKHYIFALKQGYAFAGVQWGYECFCGNDYGKYGPSANCDMQCTGDHRNTEDAICGGFWAKSIMTTGLGILLYTLL